MTNNQNLDAAQSFVNAVVNKSPNQIKVPVNIGNATVDFLQAENSNPSQTPTELYANLAGVAAGIASVAGTEILVVMASELSMTIGGPVAAFITFKEGQVLVSDSYYAGYNSTHTAIMDLFQNPQFDKMSEYAVGPVSEAQGYQNSQFYSNVMTNGYNMPEGHKIYVPPLEVTGYSDGEPVTLKTRAKLVEYVDDGNGDIVAQVTYPALYDESFGPATPEDYLYIDDGAGNGQVKLYEDDQNSHVLADRVNQAVDIAENMQQSGVDVSGWQTFEIENADGSTEEFDVRFADAEDINQEMGGMMVSGAVETSLSAGSGGMTVSVSEQGSSTLIGGIEYTLTSVVDSVTTAGEAIHEFIEGKVGDSVEWFTDGDLLNTTIAGWMANNLGDVIDGNLDLDEAFIDLAEYIGQQHIANFVVGSIGNVLEAEKMIDNVFAFEEGFSVELNGQETYFGSQHAGAIYEALGRMAVDFSLNSQGWDSDQYLKAGVTTVASVVAAEYAKSYFANSIDASGAGGVAATTSLVSGLMDSSDFNSSDWIMLGVQTAIAYSAGVSGAAIGASFGSAVPGIGTVAGAIAGLTLGKVVSSIYQGKKFYEGEFGDKEQLLNSIYQVQEVQDTDSNGDLLFDGNGDPVMIKQVAAVAEGVTIIMQEDIVQAIGNTAGEVLVGNVLNNTFFGLEGADYIEGRDGDDFLIGGEGADHLSGGNGADIIQGDDGNDIIYADAHDDIIIAGTGLDFVHGGSGDDSILGNEGNDVLLGAGGADAIQGDIGDDTLDGGYGDDLLDGGVDSDILLGNFGNDSLTGGDGDDVLLGDSGNDRLFGGAGDDSLAGGAGTDILEGSTGDDYLNGVAGTNILDGGIGDDILVAGTGSDTILGGLGDDVIFGGNADGGLGDDLLVGNSIGKITHINYGGWSDKILNGGEGDDSYFFDATYSSMGDFDLYWGVSGLSSKTIGIKTVIEDYEGVNDIFIKGLTADEVSNEFDITRENNSTGGWDLLIENNMVDYYSSIDGSPIGYEIKLKNFFNPDGSKNIDLEFDQIKFDTGQYISLDNLTHTIDSNYGPTNLAYSIQSGTVDPKFQEINLKVAEAESGLVEQSNYFTSGFINNLSEISYEEALRDQAANEFYSGGSVSEFKRARGTFGGHYKVYKIYNPTEISGDEVLWEYNEFDPNTQNPNDFEGIYNGEVVESNGTLNAQANSGWNPLHGKVIDIWVDGEFADSHFYINGDLDSAPINLDSNSVAAELPYSLGTSALSRKSASESDISNQQFSKSTVSFNSSFLIGSHINENLNGGVGSDFINGVDGNDNIDGGAGDDWLFGGDGEDEVDGGVGDDVIFGGDGDDDLTGGSGDDAIFGGDGDDYISGGDGADWIDAGDGADIIIGGSGDDIIYAGGGDDYAEGGEGLDVIYGQGGDDILYGNEGIDYLYGESGNDTLHGVEDEDHLYGGVGDDVINGNDGDDFIYGGSGYDVIDGGLGSDILDGGDGASDLVSYRDSVAGVTVDLLAGTGLGGSAEGDTLVNIERIYGSDFDDILTGNDEANRLYAFTGDDTLDGGLGNDILYGHYAGADILNGDEGDDTLYGGLAGDSLNGGNGEDRINYIYTSGGVDIDMVAGTVDGITSGLQDSLTSIERVYASNDSDIITGDSGNNRIYGYDGDDVINAGAGDDYIYGQYEGAHTLNGEAGNDSIYAGLNGDIINGGADLDRLLYNTLTVGVIANLATGIATDASGNNQDTISNIENLYGSNYDDTITGDSFSNSLYGQDGSDTLNGGDGDDFLRGENGNDYIYGDGGDDIIYGDLGNDVIDGGTGTDTISYYNSAVSLNIDLSNNNAVGSSIGLDFITNVENIVGGVANDIITGNSDDNILDGYIGNDDVYGGDGDDTLYGHEGDDSLYSGTGMDILNGGSGNDKLYAMYSGVKTLNGDSGTDSIYALIAGNTIDGGDGSYDVLSYIYSTEGVDIDVIAGTAIGLTSTIQDNFSNIEKFYGSDFTDSYVNSTSDSLRFYGYAGNDTITGGGGRDYIYGMVGDDTITANAGNDVIVGGDGADNIDGGTGTDTAYYTSSTSGVTINLLTGVHTGGEAEGDTLNNIENIYGSAHIDNIKADDVSNNLWGFDGNDKLYGYGDDDILYGGDGNDSLYGLTGDDTLYGEDGDDLLIGGTGADILDGGAGDDTVYYTSSSAAVNVNLETQTVSGGEADGDTIISIEQAYASAHNDTLTGDASSNIFWGFDGNDTIDGKAGSDILYGGDGNDTFVFSDLTHSNDNEQDIIMDFTQGSDLIDLTAFSFTSISDFAISQVSGDTAVKDNSSTFSIKLDGVYSLADTDFLFV